MASPPGCFSPECLPLKHQKLINFMSTGRPTVLHKAERGRRLLLRPLRSPRGTDGPTAPAHFVGMVVILPREIWLPPLDRALRVADHFLHFPRDLDFLEGFHARSSWGCMHLIEVNM